jgi:hypothetical protein
VNPIIHNSADDEHQHIVFWERRRAAVNKSVKELFISFEEAGTDNSGARAWDNL